MRGGRNVGGTEHGTVAKYTVADSACQDIWDVATIPDMLRGVSGSQMQLMLPPAVCIHLVRRASAFEYCHPNSSQKVIYCRQSRARYILQLIKWFDGNGCSNCNT